MTRFAGLCYGATKALRYALALAAALLMTAVVFLLLPLLEQITEPPRSDLELRTVDVANLAPPPPPPEEPKEEKREEPPPPDLADDAPPLDLSQLEIALNPGFGEAGAGDFAIRLPGADGRGGVVADSEEILSAAELDQAPRAVFQPPPEYPAELRRQKLKGAVQVLFLVDKDGRVNNPLVQKSTHAAFEAAALRAVRRWRFEPGRRAGQTVQFKMKIPITFMGA